MPFVRRRRHVYEAFQWVPDQPDPPGLLRYAGAPRDLAHVHSARGNDPAHLGDWIVPDPDGEHYEAYSDARLRQLFESVPPAT